MELIVTTKEQLSAIVGEAVRAQLQEHLPAIQQTTPETHLLTRKEAAKFLAISLPTLNEWSKNGLVIAHKCGVKVYYKKSELEQSFKQMQTRKR
jgi:excisionase family DNA binding protein